MNVYEQEQHERENRPRGSSGGGADYTWLDIEKPASIGQKTVKRVRVVQRLAWVDGPNGKAADPSQPYPQFWQKVMQHRVTLDGQFKNLTCPEDHSVEGWRDRATCPLCVLQRELWAAKRDDYDVLAKSIGARLRVFCNVVDLENVQSHWSEDGNGGWKVHPKVYGYSGKVHDDMIAFCVNLGPIEDIESGRPLLIECERTGKRKQDIRYRVINGDREPLDPALVPVAQGAFDLAGLGKPASEEDLRSAAAKIDPRVGESGGTVPSTSYAPPGGYTPPPPAGPPQGYGAAPSGPPPAAPAPPAPAPAPPAVSGTTYHVATAQGQHQGWSADQVAKHCMEHGNASVWTDGMANWAAAADVPEIRAVIDRLQRPAAPPPAPGGPPGPPPGPPPASDPYAPRGGYATDGPPAATGAPPGPPSQPPGPPGPPGAPPGPPGGHSF